MVQRGCSGNCDKREYIYTDDFQTHCCNNNKCNGAPREGMRASVLGVGVAAVVGVLWRRVWL